MRRSGGGFIAQRNAVPVGGTGTPISLMNADKGVFGVNPRAHVG